jgi:dynein heavy chain
LLLTVLFIIVIVVDNCCCCFDRYEIGLEQLSKAEDSVSVMQEKLEKIRPVLIETKKDAEDMMVLVKQETVFAMKIREGVEAEKAAAQGKANLANKIKEECDIELAKAMPGTAAAVVVAVVAVAIFARGALLSTTGNGFFSGEGTSVRC